MPTTADSSRRYGFVKPSLIKLFSMLDGMGAFIVRPFRRGGTWPEPQRILLVNLAHIGDVVLTTAAVAAISDRYPITSLTMLVSPWSEQVVRHNPRLHDVITYRPSWWDRNRGSPYFVLPEFTQLVQQVRARRFDWVINFKSFFQENLAFALARIPRRIGYGLYGGGFMQTDFAPFQWNTHTVLQHMQLAEMAGASNSNPRLELYFSTEDQQAAIPYLHTQAEGLRVAMHLGAGYPSKLWPVEHFALLASLLQKSMGAHIIIVGGKEDMPLIERFQSLSESPHTIAAGKLSITQTAALIQQCDIFIGNDSGPAHLSAAVGTPTISIFSGETDAMLWKPWSPKARFLQRHPECYRCGLQVCNRDHICMTSITPEDVMKEIEHVLA